MKQLLLFSAVLLCLTASSCKKSEAPEDSGRKTDPLLTKLESKHPNSYNNPLLQEKLKADFVKLTDSIAPLNYFSDIPLEVLSIKKNPHGKGAMVQFYADNYKMGKSTLTSDRLEFDYIALMEESQAEKLNQDGRYFVHGKKISKLDEDMVAVLTRQTYYSPVTNVEKDDLRKVLKLNAGVYLCEVDSITEVPLY